MSSRPCEIYEERSEIFPRETATFAAKLTVIFFLREKIDYLKKNAM